MRWLLLPLLLASPLAAAQTPRIEVDAEHRLVLTDLPPILAAAEVQEHLTTGLTTTLQFRVGGKIPGGARVEIRYDLWDEIFRVVAGGIDGRVERYDASSFDDLAQWWRKLRLVILDGNQLPDPWPRRLKVTADVVPFSQSEQDDTQRWFSDSIDQARRSGTGEAGRAGEKSSETLSRTFDLLLATSIQRRAVVSYPWTLPLQPSPDGSAGGAS